MAVVLQAPPPASLTLLHARIGRDSTDAAAWLLMGREYLGLADEAHGPAHRPAADSGWVRAVLDSADQALVRAAALLGGPGSSAAGDSARVLRVGAWSRRARLAWETAGIGAGPRDWGPVPADLRVPAVLEELGENLLRACPMWGVLLTADDADSYAAWYMRFARGLRPDVVVLPLAAWRSDAALRARLGADLRIARRSGDDWLAELARPHVGWAIRSVLWVAGPLKEQRVPPRDFVFAALRIALDQRDPWAAPALALYARAARATPGLCEAMGTFRVSREVATCRR